MQSVGLKGPQAIINAVAAWAIAHDDIRGMALVGSWARGSARATSDIDVILLTDRSDDYRHRQGWVAEIDFQAAGYLVLSSDSGDYGAVWSRHLHLVPAAEVELTFGRCSWADTRPIEDATRCAGWVPDHFRQGHEFG